MGIISNLLGAGRTLDWLRTPLHAAVLAFLLALSAAGGGVGVRVRRRRRGTAGREAEAVASASREPLLGLSGARGRTVLLTLFGAAGVFALLGLWAFTRPLTRTVSWPDMYRQTGTFSYAASAPRTPIYPNGSVETGQPVFLRLVRKVSVRFSYRLESSSPHAIAGDARLFATLSGDGLWQRTVALSPETSFSGDRLVLAGTLDLRALRALGAETQRITGTTSDSYALTVVPEVRIRGAVAGQSVRAAFAPPLAMRLDPVALRLESTAAAGGQPAALTRAKPGGGTRVETNTVSLFGIELAVGTARRAALLGGGAALGGGFFLGLVLLLLIRRGGDEPSRIRAQYGFLLVDVAPDRRLPERPLEVATMEGLVRLARHYDHLILHEEHEGGHSYLVEENGVVYRYTARGPHEPEARPDEEDTLVMMPGGKAAPLKVTLLRPRSVRTRLRDRSSSLTSGGTR